MRVFGASIVRAKNGTEGGLRWGGVGNDNQVFYQRTSGV